MQFDFITASIIALPACYAALVGFQFVSGIVGLWHQSGAEPMASPNSQQPEMQKVNPPSALRPQPSAFVPSTDETVYTAADHALIESMWIQQFCRTPVEDTVVPFRRTISSIHSAALSRLTVAELRALCNRRSIRWNRANNGKHLSKAQMIARLMEVAA